MKTKTVLIFSIYYKILIRELQKYKKEKENDRSVCFNEISRFKYTVVVVIIIIIIKITHQQGEKKEAAILEIIDRLLLLLIIAF